MSPALVPTASAAEAREPCSTRGSGPASCPQRCATAAHSLPPRTCPTRRAWRRSLTRSPPDTLWQVLNEAEAALHLAVDALLREDAALAAVPPPLRSDDQLFFTGPGLSRRRALSILKSWEGRWDHPFPHAVVSLGVTRWVMAPRALLDANAALVTDAEAVELLNFGTRDAIRFGDEARGGPSPASIFLDCPDLLSGERLAACAKALLAIRRTAGRLMAPEVLAETWAEARSIWARVLCDCDFLGKPRPPNVTNTRRGPAVAFRGSVESSPATPRDAPSPVGAQGAEERPAAPAPSAPELAERAEPEPEEPPVARRKRGRPRGRGRRQ